MSTERNVLDALMQRGVLVEVRCHCWGGRKALKPEDIGLETSDINEELMSLGQKRLVPKSSLSPFHGCDVRADQVLKQHSLAVPFGRYVPLEVYPELRRLLDEIVARFNAYREEWLPSYPSWREEMLQGWREAAEAAYDRMNGRAAFLPREQFVAEFMARIEALYPNVADLAGRFALEIITYQVSLPASSRMELADLDLLDAQARTREQARAQVARDAQLDAQVVLSEMVQEMRGRAAEVAERLAASLRDGGTVRQQQFDAFERFVKAFQRMNVLGDRELSETLENIQAEYLTNGASAYRGEGANALRERFSNALAGVVQIGDAPRESIRRVAEQFANVAGRRNIQL